DKYIRNYTETGNAKIIGIRRELFAKRKDGTIFPIDLAISEIILDNKKMYTGILRDISKQKAAEEKQIELMEDLTVVNKDLKDFAYIVSHDLKAPLRAIKSLSDWLYADNKDKLGEEGKEQIELISGRVMRMEKLIEGILKYSRAGNIGGGKEKIDIDEVIEDAKVSIGLPDNVKISVKSKMPVIMYPQTQIFQILLNLMSNAVKFMDKEIGEIEIDCTEENGYWKFSLADNGPGIEEKYYDKIFQVFQTLKARDEFESTGIGLAVVKKIVEGNGGKVWVDSKIGIGSTFYFTVGK
ncbi:PAS domain S-box protein, partial [candidate division KSB1 bacterium]|nr:PAS domain S-box protein [candidate division KSB1 bacterium]